MVNRVTRILALAAVWAAPGAAAFAQAYAVDGPVPAYPPEVYRAQDADGGYAVRATGPSQAYYSQPDRDRSDHASYDRDGYDQASRRGQPQGRALEDQRAHRQAPAYTGAYRQASAQRVERVETSYRFLSWAGKVEDRSPDRGSGDYAYSSSQGYAGPACPGVQPGERVLNCQYVPFAPPAPPPERESDVQMSNLYIDGGVGPSVIGGGGGGGGGPSNGQIFLGTGFSGVTAPTFSGGGSNGGNGGNGGSGGNSNGSGNGSGIGNASSNSSSSSSSSASANVSANISANITLAGGFFGHGGGGYGGGGKKGGGKSGGGSSCGCGSSGGGSGGMSGWGGSGSGGGGMSGWSGGGHKK